MAIPGPPWEVKIPGTLLQTISFPTLASVRPFIPPEFEIISYLPDRSVAGIYLAYYGQGSTREYSELGVFLGFVRFAGKTGVYISNMFVDSGDSLQLAREYLGLPKELAAFKYEHNGRRTVTISQDDRPICTISHGRQTYLWRQKAGGYAFGILGQDVVRFRADWRMRIGMTRARVEIPSDSPLKPYGVDKPRLTFCGKDGSGTLGSNLETVGRLG